MDQLKVKSYQKTKNGLVPVFKKPKASDLKDVQQFIEQLKKDKKTFSYVENNVEKSYIFNGNNYVITSKILKK